MNKSVTSKEAILKVCRQIVIDKGLSAINIRDVAKNCNASVGSIYYYFPSKTDLVNSVVESIWYEIFHTNNYKSESFIDAVDNMFKSVKEGSKKYKDFINLHSISIASKGKESGKAYMMRYFSHMKKGLVKILEEDDNIMPYAFNDSLTKEDFVDLIFSLSVSMMIQNNYNTEPLLEIIRRTVY